MLILIVNLILTPITMLTDVLNMLVSFLKWDKRFIERNSDSTNMLWNSDLNKDTNEA